MKIAIIYDPDCPKLLETAYSQTYRDMFCALMYRFDEVQCIFEDCSANDIDADVIIFFDIHSSHHIKIDGISGHRAIKYEYFNDPWQKDFKGMYSDGQKVHKLGPKERTERAISRGVQYIICPYTNLYYKYIYPHAGDMEMIWFPIAPNINRFRNRKTPLSERKQDILLNGHTWKGDYGFRPYKFRSWAYGQDSTLKLPHSILDITVPHGINYPDFLSTFAGSVALCDTHTVPKYSEIPLSGCVTFAQYHYDYEQMGFKDMESCVYVTKANFNSRINDFKNDVPAYQSIADAGRKIMENYTADKFAEYIYSHASRKH